MKIIIAITSSILCWLIAYITINKERAESVRVLRMHGSEEFESKELSRRGQVVVSIIAGIVSGIVEAKMVVSIPDHLNLIKMSVALICLTGAACNDYRERRIPNAFPITMAVVGVAYLLYVYISEQPTAEAYLVSSLLATVAVTLCLTLASVLTKHGIGYGDIKLLAALALLGGVYTISGTLFFGMALCAVFAVALLILKKKSMQDSVPFGPFIYFGFCISALASIL